jgi:hypothetical protein
VDGAALFGPAAGVAWSLIGSMRVRVNGDRAIAGAWIRPPAVGLANLGS